MAMPMAIVVLELLQPRQVGLWILKKVSHKNANYKMGRISDYTFSQGRQTDGR